MEQDLIQRIALLVVYSLLLVPVVRWRGRTVKIELSNGIPPLTWHHLFTKGLGFAIACGSSLGMIGIFLGLRYSHPIRRAIWVPIYGTILCFIMGLIIMLFSERGIGTIYRPGPGAAKRVPPIRSVTAITQGGFAFLAAFLASLAITFLRGGELNWNYSFLVGLGIFIGYFIALAALRT